MGGVLGSSLAFTPHPGVQFTLGGEAGLYYVKSSFAGQDTYSTCCGNFNSSLASVSGSSVTVNGASPALSVSSDATQADLGGRFGFAIRGNGGVTFAVADNTTLTLGGNAEYLSAVPQINHPNLGSVTTSSGSANYSSAGGGVSAPTFSLGSMVDWGASIGLSGKFD
jgi:hypothetical protein